MSETWAQLKFRQRCEQVALIKDAVAKSKTKSDAARSLGMSPQALFMFIRHNMPEEKK